MKVVVVGLGYVGLPLAMQAASVGHQVIGFDVNEERIGQLSNSNSSIFANSSPNLSKVLSEGKLHLTSHLDKIPEGSIVVIAVPTPLTKNRMPNLVALNQACEFIAENISDNSLIINESTSYIGTLRNLIQPNIENKTTAKNLKYAVAPERIDPGNLYWDIKNTPRIVSGLSEEATEQAIKFYAEFCEQVHRVSSPEIAEASKLFENTFRLVNIGLVNELSYVFNKMGWSAHEIIQAAATKPFGFMPFWPSVGVGGHCIPVDPIYLNFSADNGGVGFEFINLASNSNSSQPERIIGLIEERLGFRLYNKRVQVVGLSYKPNTPDLRESPVITLIDLLKLKGAIVTWHDPIVKEYNSEKSSPLSTEIDLGLIVTPHDVIDLSIWDNTDLPIIDLSSGPKTHGWPKFL